jgi:putative pyruvate formate lyase activating enzyme
MYPRYLESHRTGQLAKKAASARALLDSCTLCPRQCSVNRTADEQGYCRTGRMARVASYNAHFGEEAPLVGTRGSGTIFFSYCNLGCSFCQNYEISHGGEGCIVDDRQLAAMMMALQDAGCHNINFVTPSHVVPQILTALVIAVQMGLAIPLVYNSGGYDTVPTLQLLDGVVDIYMPDFKFWDDAVAERLCQAADYRRTACRAVQEMQRQVSELKIDSNGLARSGLLIRHLVMPQGLAGTAGVMQFIAGKISKDTYVNIMPQYRPMGSARDVAALARPVTEKEVAEALKTARDAGIHRLDRRRRVFALK